MDHNQFCERYAFWTQRDHALVGPKKLRAYALRHLRGSCIPRVRDLSSAERVARVEALLADDTFLRFMYGYLLTRVVEAIEDRISNDLRV